MWFFSKDPVNNFAYEVGDKLQGLEDKSIWTLHDGKHKTSGEQVSVFVFDAKACSESQLQLAKTSFKKTKTLRHPNILTYMDGLESEKVLYIVTEPVIPLETYIKTNQDETQNEMAISWGLHQIVKGLSFLINDCNFIHNNVCMSSIFVDRAGEWKLGGVDYMYPASGEDSYPPVKILHALEKYDPPEKTGGKGRATEKWSSDMWGLGILIWEVFNGDLPRNSSLKSPGKIPQKLIPNYCELVGANPRSRPNPAKFIESCRAKGCFMDNKFVDSVLFLEEIQIKDQSEKTRFFNSLPPVLDTFPPVFCKMKILPQLLHAFEFGNSGSAVLAPLFKVGKQLDSQEYQAKIVPCVVKLFSSTDRQTRVRLLQEMEQFVEHLSPAVVNDKIFPNVVQGFMDTNPVVRENTIKAMLHLAPKLNYKNLNEELLKHFARLQTKDDQGGIRTNTTVCLGKIACHLNPQNRQKIISSAYLRAMKDPFPAARQAGIIAMAATHNFFTLAESANQLLPVLVRMTMDPEKSVRDHAFKAIKCFLGKLEKASVEPDCIADLEKDVLSGGSVTAAGSGWAGWAMGGMSSLTSKLYKGKGAGPQSKSEPAKDKGSREASPTVDKPSTRQTPERTTPEPATRVQQEDDDTSKDEWGRNAWDNSWGDMNESTEQGEEEEAGGGGWDDDEWGNLEDTGNNEGNSHENKSEPSPWGTSDFTTEDDKLSASSYNWGEPNKGDFFDNVMTDLKPKSRLVTSGSVRKSQTPSPNPVQSSKVTSSGWEEDSWNQDDGWGQDQWQDTGPSAADLAKQKREEKRAQRQKEMEEKRAARAANRSAGAMKLGARKLAKD